MDKPRFEVLAANCDYPHEPDYILDRPAGYGDVYVFIHFQTPCLLGTEQGVVRGGRGDCILYTPGFPQYNRGQEVPLRNDWVHFRGGADYLAQLGLPVNRMFNPGDPGLVESGVNRIKDEILQRRLHYRQSISLQLELLLLLLARRLYEAAPPDLTPSEIAHAEGFRRLRARVHERLEEDWSVERMAGEVHLSRSRFSVLYRKLFHAGAVEDLIAARLSRACLLLSGSNLTVEAVARRCGFSSGVHFFRLFRKRYRCSPRRFCRNDAGSPPGSHHLPPE